MNAQVIEIYEFSTGIQVDGNPDNWVSRGFTGKYLNSTLKSVPISVKNAISSRHFAVAEGASSEKAAVIGREIMGDDGEWSVLATAKKGKDEKGRNTSFYRYFLCQGAGNIHHILQWMKNEKKSILVFDPFDQQIVGHPHQYQITASKQIDLRPVLENLLSDSTPIIVPFDEACVPLILNEMANRLDDHPVSWAFNVKAVVKLTSFQIIQPADKDSENQIRHAIDNTPIRPQSVKEEQKITTAIKGLTTREKFKLEHIETIEKALAKFGRISQEYWEYLFEQQGAKDAINKGIYNASMIRLLTLQAMILPETLPDFLSWIQKTKNKEHYNISSNFQQRVYRSIDGNRNNNIKLRLIEGVKFIITLLAEQPALLDSTVKLLTDEQGIWQHYYKTQVMPKIDNDFRILEITKKSNIQESNYPNQNQNQKSIQVLNHTYWKIIYNHLLPFWQPNTNKDPLKQYQPIADFFYKIRKADKFQKSYPELQLAALFSHISQGEIPNKLFKQLDNSPKSKDGMNVDVYGLRIKRKVPWLEKIYKFILKTIVYLWEFKIPFLLTLILMFISFLAGILGSDILKDSFSSLKQKYNSSQSITPPNSGTDKASKENSTPVDLPANSTDNQSSNPSRQVKAEITPKQFTTAFDNFQRTKQVITTINNQLLIEFKNVTNQSNERNNLEELKNEIIKATKITLDPGDKSTLQYGSVFQPSPQDVQDNNEVGKWIKAIYSYQQKKKQQLPKITPTGYLVPQTDITNRPLKDDIRNNIDPKFKNMTH